MNLIVKRLILNLKVWEFEYFIILSEWILGNVKIKWFFTIGDYIIKLGFYL